MTRTRRGAGGGECICPIRRPVIQETTFSDRAHDYRSARLTAVYSSLLKIPRGIPTSDRRNMRAFMRALGGLTDPTLRNLLAKEKLILRYRIKQAEKADMPFDETWVHGLMIGLDTALRRVQNANLPFEGAPQRGSLGRIELAMFFWEFPTSEILRVRFFEILSRGANPNFVKG